MMVPQTRGNGALDLFNNQQARFFQRAVMVELGAHSPLCQQAMSRRDWAAKHWSTYVYSGQRAALAVCRQF